MRSGIGVIVRRVAPAVALALALGLSGGAAALAGDGGTVEMGPLPTAPRAGEALTLAFIVRTHGRPIDVFGDKPVRPYLSARNSATGESLRIDGRKAGPPGHFAVEVTFPSEGEWRLTVKAEPLVVGVWSGSLTVLPAIAAQSSEADPAGISAPLSGGAVDPPALIWRLGVAVVLLAAGLLLPAARRARSRRAVPSATGSPARARRGSA